jgi:hypothetical protein
MSIVLRWMLPFAFFLSACQPLLVSDISVQFAAVETTAQAAVRSCARLLNEKRIEVDEAVKCDLTTRQAFLLIDAGMAAAKIGNVSAAENALAQTRAVLVEVERYVKP